MRDDQDAIESHVRTPKSHENLVKSCQLAPLSSRDRRPFAIAIYAYVLPLPFFRDDMVMLLWLRDMPWGKLWVDATGFPYYRPLSFSTLKLSELVFGWPSRSRCTCSISFCMPPTA